MSAVTQRAPDGERRLARRDRLLTLLTQVAGDRASLEEAGALRRGQVVGKAQGAGVLGRGLAVGVQRGGLLGGGDRVLQHRLLISGRLGIVRQPRQVTLALGCLAQRGQDTRVQEPAPVRRDGGQDGLAGQLVAEGETIAGSPQQAPGDALVHFVEDRTGNAEQELRLERRADHRGEVEDRPRLGREPGRTSEDGVAD